MGILKNSILFFLFCPRKIQHISKGLDRSSGGNLDPIDHIDVHFFNPTAFHCSPKIQYCCSILRFTHKLPYIQNHLDHIVIFIAGNSFKAILKPKFYHSRIFS